MEPLFSNIRKACPPAVWSKGVELARREVAVGKSRTPHEIEMHLMLPGAVSALTVVLYPEDGEWSCDCNSPHDACAHVACAVISLKNAEQENRDLFSTPLQTGYVKYHFTLHTPTSLRLTRSLFLQGKEQPIQAPLAVLTRNSAVRFTPTPQDLKADALLVQHPHTAPLTPTLLHSLMNLLRGQPHLFLNNTPIQITDPVAPFKAVVEDAYAGHIRIRFAPHITPQHVFSGNTAHLENALALLVSPDLSAQDILRYKEGVVFGPQDIAEMTASLLPQLRTHMPVQVHTQHLPQLDPSAQPRIHWQLEEHAHTLRAMPTLVYGNPPFARIDAGVVRYMGTSIPVRNLAQEKALLEQLQTSVGFSAGVQKSYTGLQAVQMAKVLDAHAPNHPVLKRFEWHGTLQPVLTVQEQGVEATFHAGSHRVSAQAVFEAFAQNASVVPLMEGGFAGLPTDWLSQHGAQLQALLQTRNEQRMLQPHQGPAWVRLLTDLQEPIPAFLEPYQKMVEGFTHLPEARLPQDLTASLRSYQTEGVRWLQHLQTYGLGALLADDMGLGKTLQALCTFTQGTLVVAPTSVVHNWMAELKRFRPSLTVQLYHGPQRVLNKNADVVVTTYALLRIDQEILSAHRWNTVVLDEAHAIKNKDSQVARAAYALQSHFKIAITGTPVENRLEELWSHMHFLNPGLLGSYNTFSERYSASDTHHGVLKKTLQPFVLRRKKQDVAPELPSRTHMVLRCTLTEEEQRVYNAVQSATLTQALKALNEQNNVMLALEALLRLRQAACHSALVPGQQATHSSKTLLLVETLQDIVEEGHKALVFSQWTSFLDLIQPHLQQQGISYTRLDGHTTQRAQVVEHFQQPNGPSVMLLSLKAGGTGLNLTAADHVFLMDPWWNPAAEDQAADRAHRIGQTKPVVISQLIAENTVEERILLLQQHKRLLAESLFEEGQASLRLTQEDMRSLLETF